MDAPWTLPWRPSIHQDYNKDLIDAYLQHHDELRPPTQLELKAFQADLCRLTRSLIKSPYCSSTWCLRATILLRLQFPELALGDAFKAKCLVEDCRKQSEKRPMQRSPSIRMASDLDHLQIQIELNDVKKSVTLVFAQSLLLANCFTECLYFVDDHEAWFASHSDRDRLRRTAQAAFDVERNYHIEKHNANSRNWIDYGSNSDIPTFEGGNDSEEPKEEWNAIQASLEEQEDVNSGAIHLRAYPWLTTDLLCRSSDTIGAVNMELAKLAIEAGWPMGSFKISRSPVRQDIRFQNVLDRRTDVMGVFTTITVPPGRLLFRERTSLCAMDDPEGRCSSCRRVLLPSSIKSRCCGASFCSIDPCGRFAHDCYHKASYWKDVDEFPISSDKESRSAKRRADDQLLLQTLRCALNTPQTHPLKSPIINRMTVQYHREEAHRFSLNADIIRPIEMLQGLGVDVYANHNFDTWVLQTIQARIRNNVREMVEDEHYYVAINPIYLFFNHSCDPNVSVEIDTGDPQSTLTLKALRAVKAGEEMFISYMSEEDLQLPLYMRRRKLRDWMGAACQCSRCKEDEKEYLKGDFHWHPAFDRDH